VAKKTHFFKKVTFWFLSAIIWLGCIFGVSEIFVRIFKYRAFNEMTFYRFRQSDPILNHSFIPNSSGRLGSKEFRTVYEINTFGFRDYNYSFKKPSGVKRILVLGDSYVEGHGVNIDESFIKILERRINSRIRELKYKYEVINCGILSYSPILEYLQLKEKGLSLDPDLVILFLDQSDLQDDYVYSKHAIFDNNGKPKAVPKTGFFVGEPKKHKFFLNRFLLRHSALYVYLNQKLRKIKNKKEKEIKDLIAFGDIETDRLFFLRENPKDFKIHWSRTASYLRLINGMLKEKKIDFVLVVYPYAHQVDPYEWECRSEWGFKKGTLYPKGQYFAAAQEFCNAEGIKFIDLYEAFKKFKETNGNIKLFYNIDGHWTKRTHEVVAQSLYTRLCADGFIK
jgi:hypothetical protein